MYTATGFWLLLALWVALSAAYGFWMCVAEERSRRRAQRCDRWAGDWGISPLHLVQGEKQ